LLLISGDVADVGLDRAKRVQMTVDLFDQSLHFLQIGERVPTRLLQPPVFFSVPESVWEKGLPYTCKSVFCLYFSVFPDSV
jgi:hypothetical protein